MTFGFLHVISYVEESDHTYVFVISYTLLSEPIIQLDHLSICNRQTFSLYWLTCETAVKKSAIDSFPTQLETRITCGNKKKKIRAAIAIYL